MIPAAAGITSRSPDQEEICPLLLNVAMSNKDSVNNELSWLKSGSNNPEGSSKSSSVTSPRRADVDDTPSWLYEDTIPKKEETKALIVEKTKNGDSKSGIKWKHPINKKIHNEGDEDDESADAAESCCCCFPSDPMLFAFQCFHLTAGLTGLAALSANIYVFSGPTISVRDAIVRSYALLFCILIVIIELDWRLIVNKIRFADWWVFRGLFYTFVGFITCKSQCPFISSIISC